MSCFVQKMACLRAQTSTTFGRGTPGTEIVFALIKLPFESLKHNPMPKEFNFWNMDASRLHFKWFCWGGIHVIVVLFPEVLYKGDVCAWEDNSACFHSEKYCIILMLRKLLLDVFQHYPKALCSYSSKCSIRWHSFLLYFLDLNMQKLKNERREKLSASFQCCSMICHKLALIQIFFAWSQA